MTTKAVTCTTQRCLILNPTFLRLRTSMVLGKVTPTCHICCCVIIWFQSSAFSLIMFAFAGSASFPTYQASFTNHFQLIFIQFPPITNLPGVFQQPFSKELLSDLTLIFLCSQIWRTEGCFPGPSLWPFVVRRQIPSLHFILTTFSPLGPLCAHGSCWLLWTRRDGKVCATVV